MAVATRIESETDVSEELNFRAVRPQIIGSVGTAYFSQILRNSAPLLAGDLTAVSICTVLGWSIVRLFNLVFADLSLGLSPIVPGLLLPASAMVFVLAGMYPGTGLNRIVEFRKIILSVTAIFLALFVMLLVSGHQPAGSFVMCLVAVCSAWLVAPFFRSLMRSRCAKLDWWGAPVLILGGNRAAERVYRSLSKAKRLGLRPIGIVTDDRSAWRREPGRHVIGTLDDIPAIIERYSTYLSVVALSKHDDEDLSRKMLASATAFPHYTIVTQEHELTQSLWCRARDCAGYVGVYCSEDRLLPIPQIQKRCLDLAITFMVGTVAIPMIVALAMLVKLTSPGPAFYRQERIGKGGRRFWIWKLRTMVINGDELLEKHLAHDEDARNEWNSKRKLKRDPRVTAIGRMMRKTSLDELPQILNVLVGDMSIVGPRPISNDEEIEEYGVENLSSYIKVRPGITGMWQISGRNKVTFRERVLNDLFYVRNWSLWLDLYILARTVKVVLWCEGAY